MRYAAWCKCGASMTFDAYGNTEQILELVDAWWSGHSGEGHGEATPEQAARARNKYLRHSVEQPTGIGTGIPPEGP